MIDRLSTEDVELINTIFSPVALAECLFSNMNGLTEFEETKFSKIREYQFNMLSYEWMYVERLDSTDAIAIKEAFKRRERASQVYCFGSRRHGKSLIVEIVDMILAMLMNPNEKCALTSFDATHIRGIIEEVIRVLEHHPFVQTLDARINRSPTYTIRLRNGFICDGINMNLAGSDPGEGFFQKHLTRLYIEEASREEEVVYRKRIDSISEFGCVIRSAGMADFTKHTPAGKIFYDLSLSNWVVNYPQFINPMWTEKENADAIKKFGGRDSIGYRIFVLGEVVEDGLSVLDMARVRRNYDTETEIKHIELNKDNYHNYDMILSVVDRPKEYESLYIAIDVGENVSEIIVIQGYSKFKYRYLYNISLYNLTDKETFSILRYLGEHLHPTCIAIDASDGEGRSIYRSLEEIFPKENLGWVGFNEKIQVDFAKDEYGNIVIVDGEIQYIEEFVADWSIKRLKDILYEPGKIIIPMDYKLDGQLNSVIAVRGVNRVVFKCKAAEDHLLAAWRVFAIVEWQNYMKIIKPIQRKSFCKTGV